MYVCYKCIVMLSSFCIRLKSMVRYQTTDKYFVLVDFVFKFRVNLHSAEETLTK